MSYSHPEFPEPPAPPRGRGGFRGDRQAGGPRGGRRFRSPFPGGPGGPFAGFGDGFPGPFGGQFPGGPGGPFRGGRGGRGGPRARRGDIRSAVLGLLAQSPTNGYGLIKAIGERTDGAWRPSPGSIYPTLAQLVDEGLITQTEGPRGPYTLTDAGRQHVETHAEEIDAAFSRADGGERHDDELTSAVRKLLMATAPFRADVSAEQESAAVAAIDAARKELHRILAE